MIVVPWLRDEVDDVVDALPPPDLAALDRACRADVARRFPRAEAEWAAHLEAELAEAEATLALIAAR